MPSPGEPVVLISLGPGELLALTPMQLAQARERAREILGAGTAVPPAAPANGGKPELLTAKEMQQRTKVKATWFLESARAGTVPHHRLGRYVRFDLAEVCACTRGRSEGAR